MLPGLQKENCDSQMFFRKTDAGAGRLRAPIAIIQAFHRGDLCKGIITVYAEDGITPLGKSA